MSVARKLIIDGGNEVAGDNGVKSGMWIRTIEVIVQQKNLPVSLARVAGLVIVVSGSKIIEERPRSIDIRVERLR